MMARGLCGAGMMTSSLVSGSLVVARHGVSNLQKLLWRGLNPFGFKARSGIWAVDVGTEAG